MKKRTILITIVIAVIGGIILFGKLKNYIKDEEGLEENLEKTKVIIRVDDLRKFTVNSLEKNDSIYLENTEYRLGKIEKVESEKYLKEIINTEGKMIYAEVPEKYSVFITLDAEVRIEGDRYFSRENRQLNVNSEMKFSTYKTLLQGKIIDIENK